MPLLSESPVQRPWGQALSNTPRTLLLKSSSQYKKQSLLQMIRWSSLFWGEETQVVASSWSFVLLFSCAPSEICTQLFNSVGETSIFISCMCWMHAPAQKGKQITGRGVKPAEQAKIQRLTEHFENVKDELQVLNWHLNSLKLKLSHCLLAGSLGNLYTEAAVVKYVMPLLYYMHMCMHFLWFDDFFCFPSHLRQAHATQILWGRFLPLCAFIFP